MRRMANKKIRVCLVEHEMHQYELAEKLGFSDSWLCEKFRKELPDDIQDKICKIIEGNNEEILNVRLYFRRPTVKKTTVDQREKRIKQLYEEIRERELEADLLREQEREAWLYEKEGKK